MFLVRMVQLSVHQVIHMIAVRHRLITAVRPVLMHGFVPTTRYFEIETLSDDSCILANGEIFDGLLSGLMPKADRSQLRRAFELVNEAAKARAEQAAREGVSA